MTIKNLSDVSPVGNVHNVDVRPLFDSEYMQVVHILLKPGEQLKKHITPVDVVFFVLEGEGIVEIGDEKHSVVVNTVIESPKDIPHCWYNKSDKDLRFLVIKAPRPGHKSRLL